MVKTDTISLRRRHLLIAGAAAAAAPGTLLANECVPLPGRAARPTVAELATEMAGEKLIVSGRVVGADCKPLAGALVELWSVGEGPGTSAGAEAGASTSTDGDGRFMVTSSAPVRGDVHIRVSYKGQTLVTRAQLSRENVFRDESNVWRTTVGLSFA